MSQQIKSKFERTYINESNNLHKIYPFIYIFQYICGRLYELLFSKGTFTHLNVITFFFLAKNGRFGFIRFFLILHIYTSLHREAQEFTD